MGERGQIFIKDTGVYLYTHWGGYELKETLQKALAKNWRWGDEEYLARVIFSVMIEDEVNEETGYGIGTQIHGDLNHPLLIVDVNEKTITEDTEEPKTWTFKEFVKEDFSDHDD